jgi:hypothetical protein
MCCVCAPKFALLSALSLASKWCLRSAMRLILAHLSVFVAGEITWFRKLVRVSMRTVHLTCARYTSMIAPVPLVLNTQLMRVLHRFAPAIMSATIDYSCLPPPLHTAYFAHFVLLLRSTAVSTSNPM